MRERQPWVKRTDGSSNLWQPLIGARDVEKARAAAEGLRNAIAVQVDVTDEGSISAALDNVGKLDHIVVTASAHHNVPVTELDQQLTTRAFEAKVIGPLLLAKHAARVLPATGSIVLFSGFAAWKPQDGYSIMGITNGAVSFAATHLAKELAPIRVNAISPGVIDSGSWRWMEAADREQFYRSSAEASFAGRVGSNSDITDAVLYLLSAGFMTGETLHVEGGARFA